MISTTAELVAVKFQVPKVVACVVKMLLLRHHVGVKVMGVAPIDITVAVPDDADNVAPPVGHPMTAVVLVSSFH